MYQSASNTPVLADAWVKFAEMDPHEAIDVALEVAGGLADEETYHGYLDAHGENGLRSLVAAIAAIPHLADEDELHSLVIGDIVHDFANQSKGLMFLPRTMSRFEVDENRPALV